MKQDKPVPPIQSLYETHLFVSDLKRSEEFYRDVMGLELCHHVAARKVSFFWIGQPKQSMLGIWETPKDQIDLRHFAFECDAQWILDKSIPFLKERGLSYWNFLNDDTDRPMVFSWVPAIAIYFHDPDGHYLEFIGKLDGPARPDLGVMSYEDWQSMVL